MPAEIDEVAAGALRDVLKNNLNMLEAAERAGLPGRGRSEVKREALRAAGRVVRREMKSRVRVRTGQTKRRIRLETKVDQGGRNVGIIRVPPPWNVLEYGRKPGVGSRTYPIRRANRRYGGAPAYPFIVVSIRATEFQQLVAAGEAMRKTLARLAVRVRGGA